MSYAVRSSKTRCILGQPTAAWISPSGQLQRLLAQPSSISFCSARMIPTSGLKYEGCPTTFSFRAHLQHCMLSNLFYSRREDELAKAKKKRGRKPYTAADVKLLKQHSKARTPVAKIAKQMKRTQG